MTEMISWGYHGKLYLIRLPLHSIFCQGMLPVFQRQRVLKNIDQRLFTRQAALSIEQEIPKALC